jgi:hypothetical protein
MAFQSEFERKKTRRKIKNSPFNKKNLTHEECMDGRRKRWVRIEKSCNIT